MEKLHATTSVRLTTQQVEKLEQLANALRVSRNRIFGLLIDSAEIQAQPSVSVGLEKNSRYDAMNFDPFQRQSGW